MAVTGVNQVNYNDFYKQINNPQAAAQKIEEQPTSAEKQDERLTTGQKFDSFVDKFNTNIQNSADLNDTVVVPRTIFKGYLSFMAGTTLMAIAPIIKKEVIKEKIKDDVKTITKKINLPYKILNTAGWLTALLGTYFFVRPYLIKNKPSQKESEQIKEKTQEPSPEATGLKP